MMALGSGPHHDSQAGVSPAVGYGAKEGASIAGVVPVRPLFGLFFDRRRPMSFGIYSIGFAIMIGGLIYAAYLLHIPAHWIAVGAVVLLGVGILKGVKTTRQKDPVG
jgi:hypothetical protein